VTLDEILSEQIKRLSPNLRAQLKAPSRDASKSLLGGGIGLSRVEPTGDSYPRDFAGRASGEDYSDSSDLEGGPGRDRLSSRGGGTNVIIQGDQGPPAPASRPGNWDEKLQVFQAGIANANSELAPLLSDWRTSPAAALTAAIGGYGRGSYAAQRDLAAGRAEAQKAEREAAQRAAQDKLIAELPPDQRFLAELDRDAFAQARIKQAFPEPLDPAIAAQLGQSQKQFEAQMGFNQQKESADQAQFAAQQQVAQQQFMAQQELQLQELAQRGMISQQELALRRAELSKGGAPEALETVMGPDGKPILIPRSQAAGKTPFMQGSAAEALETVVGPDGKPVFVPRSQAAGQTPFVQNGGTAPDKLTKLISVRDSLAPDDPNRKIYEAAIQKETSRSQGLTVYDANGNPIVTTGSGPGAAPVTQAGQNKISQYRAAREALGAATKDYKDLVAKTGGSLIPGSASVDTTELDAAQKRVFMGAKNLYELGAPTGPDIKLLESLVPSATGLGGILNPSARVDAGLKALEKDIEVMTNSVERGYGGENAVTRPEPPAAPAAPAPVAAAPKPQGYGPGQSLPPKKNADDLTYFGFAP
jgi:hypothetical protein